MLSVVIPALNAARTLPACLAALDDGPRAREVVVVDGGSADDTCRVAAELGARVIAAPRGRGTQLAAGAGAARGDGLLFLHADTRLPPGWGRAASAFLAAPAHHERAAYWAFALDDPSPAARRLERMVAWRCRTLGLPYGDQGLLIRRRFYDALGGFASLPLMEDVDLARRIGRRRLVPLDMAAVSSAERYRRDGYLRRPLRNLTLLGLYFAGVSPHRLARWYG